MVWWWCGCWWLGVVGVGCRVCGFVLECLMWENGGLERCVVFYGGFW